MSPQDRQRSITLERPDSTRTKPHKFVLCVETLLQESSRSQSFSTRVAFHVRIEMLAVIVNCPSLTAPPNGQLSGTDVAVGSTVQVTCNIGYQLSGSETRTCGANGAWSGTDALCNSRSPQRLKNKKKDHTVVTCLFVCHAACFPPQLWTVGILGPRQTACGREGRTRSCSRTAAC